MVHHELVEYISTALRGGIAEPQIIQALTSVGWIMTDIQEALGVVKGETKNTDSSFQSVIQRASQETHAGAREALTQMAASTIKAASADASTRPQAGIQEQFSGIAPRQKHPFVLIVGILFVLMLIGGGVYYGYARIGVRQPLASTEQAPLVPKDIATPGATFVEVPTPLTVALAGSITKNKDGYDARIAPLIFTHDFGNDTVPGATTTQADAPYMYIFKKSGRTITQGPITMDTGKVAIFLETVKLGVLPDSMAIIETASGSTIYEKLAPANFLPTLTLEDIVFESPTTTISWKRSASSTVYYYAEISNDHFSQKPWGTSDEPSDPHTLKAIDVRIASSSVPHLSIKEGSLSFSALGRISGDVQIAVYASDGFNTRVAFSKKISVPDQPRHIGVKIHPPQQSSQENSLFISASTTPDLSGTTLRWSSSIDGLLFKPSASSTGMGVVCTNLTPGKHTISAVATTRHGYVASSTIAVTVPDPRIKAPEKYSGWTPTPECK